MAKKAELLEKAAELKLEVSEKNTIAEIEAAINAADAPKVEVVEVAEEVTTEVVEEVAEDVVEEKLPQKLASAVIKLKRIC